MDAAEKIKQRLLGLLGVSIILLAFVPVITEEPATYLEVVPTRVPLAPVVDEPAPLFESMANAGDMIAQQVSAEREGYAAAVHSDADHADASHSDAEREAKDPVTRPSAMLVPLDFLTDRKLLQAAPLMPALPASDTAQQSQPIDATGLAKGHALSRAWVVVLQRGAARAPLEVLRATLITQRIPSFVTEVKAAQAPEFVLLVGPELRRKDAQERMRQLQADYPDAVISIEPYFPGAYRGH
jgi:cell division septation protein DedD